MPTVASDCPVSLAEHALTLWAYRVQSVACTPDLVAWDLKCTNIPTLRTPAEILLHVSHIPYKRAQEGGGGGT